jgi:hypothetical protein
METITNETIRGHFSNGVYVEGPPPITEPNPDYVTATPRTDAWRKQDTHTLERAFQFMELLERELADYKEALAISNRSADDQMFQKREAEAQRDRLADALRKIRNLKPEVFGDHWCNDYALKTDDVHDICDDALAAVK